MRYPDGAIISSLMPRYRWGLPSNRLLGFLRGVITAVHWPDDESNQSKTGFEVDVLFYDRRWMPNIPVACYMGAGDGDMRTPQATTRALDFSAYLQYQPGDDKSILAYCMRMATPINLMDGDHVIVTWGEGKNTKPLVTGYITHPRRKNPVKKAYQPPAEEQHHGEATGFARQIRHAGAKVGLDEGGNIYLDARLGGEPNGDAERMPKDGPLRSIFLHAGDGAKLVATAGGGKFSKIVRFVMDQYNGVRMDIPKDAKLRVNVEGYPEGGRVGESGRIEARDAYWVERDEQWRKWAEAVEKAIDDAGGPKPAMPIPGAPSDAGDLSVPGIEVPQQSNE